ncbi:MAG: 5-methylthioadenosine/S-adenosylhomocysteine deaminase [Thermoleophilaceae bacterium]|nr:5-methylthioadenosine/S-adenosylhomocysteine deaminase [Thermoleophilaceae bacterium]
MAELLIDHATLITMNSSRAVIEDGAVAIDAGRLVAVGPSSEVAATHRAARTIDAGGAPVLPGFVNAHFHLYSVLHKGASFMWDDGDLWSFLRAVYGTLLPAVESWEDRYYVSLLPLVEMVKAGFTCTIDLNEWPDVDGVDATIKAFEDSGMRGAVARSLMDSDPWDTGATVQPDIGRALKETVELIEGRRADDRVGVWFYPVAPHQCSDELMAEVTRLAQAKDVGVATHLHETTAQVDRWKAETGRSPIADYQARGVPLLTPRLNAGHCVHVDERDIELLAAAGAHPVHNPMTNGGLGSGLAPVPDMLRAGLRVALGVDDGATDMFDVMRTALLLQKTAHRDATVLKADAVLEMATLHGAEAMLLGDDVGSLEPGKRADLIVLDVKQPNTSPLSGPITTFLTYCATGANVDTVLIDGRIVMEKRRIQTVDEAEVMAKVQEIMDRIPDSPG